MAESRGKHFSTGNGSDDVRSEGIPDSSLEDTGSYDGDSTRAPKPSSATSLGSTSGFVPIISGEGSKKGSKRHGKKDQNSSAGHFRETDPYDLSGKRSRDPRKKRVRIASTILFVVGIVLIAVAGGMWLYSQKQYADQDAENEKLAAYATVDDTGNTAPTVDWASLKAINDDVVGWVQIPGTVVSFPVYQASDNDYYLHTNAEGNYSLGGQVFMDSENTAPGMVDQQTIIYGHHLRNGAMFKPIADMDNQEMFDSVSTVWYVTETGTYELEPLFLYYTNENDTNVRQFSFASTDEFHTYLTGLLSSAVTSRSDASQIISSTDHVLTLCTCNYISGYGRTILVCVPKSEANVATAATGATTTDASTSAVSSGTAG